MTDLCSVDTCLRHSAYAGMCVGHYGRWRRHGDTNPDVPLVACAGDPETRFFQKVTVARAEDCWLWQGALTKGYGAFRGADKKRHEAHRWAYEFLRAPIPPGLTIDHLCRVKTCVNPWHLELVTRQENARRSCEWRWRGAIPSREMWERNDTLMPDWVVDAA
jgi:hypothetical protein